MKIFISYSHRDEDALELLHKHLAMLRRSGLLDEWYDREILAGGQIDEDVTHNLETSDLFLALVSPDFLASDYCYEREMQRALERHENGTLRVIPFILEPCDWKASPLKQFKAFPKDGKPVSEWANTNSAYLDLISGLRRLVAHENQVIAPVMDDSTPPNLPSDRYRVKKDFDEIDRSDFRTFAFNTISEYFEQAASEIDQIHGLRARFARSGPTTFGCTLINKGLRQGGLSHITMHQGSGNFGMGDISYSFQENAPVGTANGWLTIESNDYDLLLKSNSFGFEESEKLMSPKLAAEKIWKEFVSNGGISYD